MTYWGKLSRCRLSVSNLSMTIRDMLTETIWCHLLNHVLLHVRGMLGFQCALTIYFLHQNKLKSLSPAKYTQIIGIAPQSDKPC